MKILDIVPVFGRHIEYQQAQRARLLRHPRGAARRAFGDRGLQALERAIDGILDRTIVAGADLRRAAVGHR